MEKKNSISEFTDFEKESVPSDQLHSPKVFNKKTIEKQYLFSVKCKFTSRNTSII